MSNPLYIVTFNTLSYASGRRWTGSYELDTERMSQRMIADDIIGGQFDDVEKVYECFPGESCQDITDDIARMVLDHFQAQQEAPRPSLRTWLQNVLGLSAIA